MKKKYIDTADEKVVKIEHALLEVDAEADWWDDRPKEVWVDIKQPSGSQTRGNNQPRRSKEKISAMVYQIAWTPKALETYVDNMNYLQTVWVEKVFKNFTLTVEKKLQNIAKQPGVGSARNKKQKNIRYTVLHKRVS